MIKPILFNTEMVQAILEGRKTTTRRIIKPHYKADEYGFQICTNVVDESDWYVEKTNEDGGSFENTRYINPPYKVGDILYVRETWQELNNIYNSRHYIYKASPDIVPEHCYYVTNGIWDSDLTWKPSIFMPKEAARIFLKVTGVRVEKLQDITEEGAKAEGAYKLAQSNPTKCVENKDVDNGSYLNGFKRVWFKTLPKYYKDYATFEGNPYVWVIEFQRVERPKDFIEGGDK